MKTSQITRWAESEAHPLARVVTLLKHAQFCLGELLPNEWSEIYIMFQTRTTIVNQVHNFLVPNLRYDLFFSGQTMFSFKFNVTHRFVLFRYSWNSAVNQFKKIPVTHFDWYSVRWRNMEISQLYVLSDTETERAMQLESLCRLRSHYQTHIKAFASLK